MAIFSMGDKQITWRNQWAIEPCQWPGTGIDLNRISHDESIVGKLEYIGDR